MRPIISTRIQHPGAVAGTGAVVADELNKAVKHFLNERKQKALLDREERHRAEDKEHEITIRGNQFEHESGMQGARFEHEGSILNRQQGHAITIQEMRAALEKEIQEGLFAHQTGMQERDQTFQGAQNEANRLLERYGIDTTASTTRRGQDLGKEIEQARLNRDGNDAFQWRPQDLVSLYGQIYPPGSENSDPNLFQNAVRGMNAARTGSVVFPGSRVEPGDRLRGDRYAPMPRPAEPLDPDEDIGFWPGPTQAAADSIAAQRQLWDAAAARLRADRRNISILGPRP